MNEAEHINLFLDRLEGVGIACRHSGPGDDLACEVVKPNLRVMPRQPISTTLSEQTLANVLISLEACANHFDGQAREFARETLKQVQKEVGNG